MRVRKSDESEEEQWRRRVTAEEEAPLKQEGKGDGSEKAKGCKERCMRKTQRRERQEKVGNRGADFDG